MAKTRDRTLARGMVRERPLSLRREGKDGGGDALSGLRPPLPEGEALAGTGGFGRDGGWCGNALSVCDVKALHSLQTALPEERRVKKTCLKHVFS